jgi:hypothetical protein
MRTRALLVLAIATVISGAPSAAFGAGSNVLSAPTASPVSGTTATLFTLSVRYAGGSPALSVRASIANGVLSMALVSGSPSEGTWRATTVLPYGAWPTSFHAVANQGRNPSIAGPTVSVGIPVASLPPSGTDSPADSGPPAPPSDGPETVEGETPASTPTAAPAAPGATQAPATTNDGSVVPSKTSNSDPSASIAPAPSEADADAPPASGDPSVAQPGSERPAATPASGGSDAGTPRQPGVETAAANGSIPIDPQLVPAVLAVGLSGMAAVVLFASFLVLAGRRRRIAKDGAAIGADAAVARRSVDEEVAATLHRRTLRRSRMRLDEDPIIAAIGVDPPVETAVRRSDPRSSRPRT